MSKGIIVSQQKLAEKLIILNDRTVGMQTRVYNIKKACGDAKSKPSFLSDRSLEPALKYITKKFPSVDIRGGGASLQAVSVIKQDIIKSLSLYYSTFVDLLELRDHVSELLTIMDACQVQLNITLNYDLCQLYLNLVSDYISLMILLSRVDDRRAVLGLYNTAHEMQHGSSDPTFPRLGQMILDYDTPLKKLAEEFIPHSKVLLLAVSSLASVYLRRNLTADDWRKAQMISIVAKPEEMLHAAQTNTIPCEYLSLDAMDRWIILSLTLCHHVLQHYQQRKEEDVYNRMWRQALENGLTTRLFRDEVISTHPYIQSFFENIKGYSNICKDIKEFYNTAVKVSALIHRDRRKFLRTALKELCLILADQPGLLGPKVLFVFMGLAFTRDEIWWLLRHTDNWPQKAGQKTRSVEDIIDRQLPELLFYLEELRSLVTKYSQVIQRYYIQYLVGYDTIALNELIQASPTIPEDESIILSSFCQSMGELSVDGLSSDPTGYNFRGLRLDWCRLQAYSSVARASFILQDHEDLAWAMNTAVFHLKMVDYLDEMLNETSDLSVYAFYTRQFEQHFQMCLEFPSQARYVCVFPQLCSQFTNCLHELCPEERIHIVEKALSLSNLFLDEMSKEAANVIANICDQQCVFADQLLPKHCAKLVVEEINNRKKAKNGPGVGDKKGSKQQQQQLVPARHAMPGEESYRRTREEMSMTDKLHFALTELCYSINHYQQIVVWEHTFAPREYLSQQLETRFNKALVDMAMYNAKSQEIAKPSELVSNMRAYMNFLQTLENYVSIDMTRIFNSVLLQQSQPQDSRGDETITALYTRWYLEVFLRRVSSSQILFSAHSMSFRNNPDMEGVTPFIAEEYADFNEFRALAELLGPYGVKFMCERLMWHVTSQIGELKVLVVQNKETLRNMRSSFDKPDKMRDLFRQLTVTDVNRKALDAVDNLLQRVTIIGEILSFNDLLQASLNDVLSDRIPFLLSSILDFKRNFPEDNPEILTAFEMCSAAGVKCSIDASLVAALKARKSGEENQDEDYQICCLLVVFIAVALPKLARSDSTFFKATWSAHLNNSHCVAKAVSAIVGALFTLHNRGDIVERMKEFLALASSSLLRIGLDPEKDAIKNKESIYLLLDQIVEESPWLTVDLLESCFPYILLRSSYHFCYKQEESPATA